MPPLVAPAAELTPGEVARYSRHLIIPDIGTLGQRRLKNARVLVIGAGGLGSPTLLYLAAAGVGTLGIVEFDTVEARIDRTLCRMHELIAGARDVVRAHGLGRRSGEVAVRVDPNGLRKWRRRWGHDPCTCGKVLLV